ncbi:MAG: PAS domain S-box protein [Labilibaculum sp.]|nr:PAS domain S-box protein [Labilibaculum sp.]MBI9056257.1 PAS domain S-box protein [Labilibaculum sp.]
MTDSIFLSLIQNMAMLLSFSILYEYLWVKKRSAITIWNKLVSGIIIGFIAIVLMLSSWEYEPGMVFDTRSVVLSISGLFFGAIPTIVAMLVAGIYRFSLGGDGVVMGIAVIVSSGSIGIYWNKTWKYFPKVNQWVKYLLMGFVVHIGMLACSIFLPSDIIWSTLSYLIIPLLTVYPLANLLLGLFMSRQMQNWKNKHALNHSEEKYSHLYENMNDAFVVLDMHGKVVECNNAYREMLGYSNEEILCLTCHDLTPSNWVAVDNKIMEEEVLIYGNSKIYEKECTRKDGSLIPIEVRIHLLKDENGNPDGFWAMVRDISQRKQAELEVENEKSQLKILIETVPEMIWLKNPEGVYLSCNRLFEQFNGLENNELIGKTDFDFYPEELAEFYWQKDLAVLSSSESVRFVSWAVSAKEGKRILTETIKTPMHDVDGKLLGVLGVSRDITEIKKTEEELVKAKEKAEESDKLKSIFLANMSHEIRTPMNAIMGFSELLVTPEIDDDEKSQYINIIQSSGNRLLQLIDDIVDVSKLELDQLSINKSESNLYELFTHCINVFKNGSLLSEKVNVNLNLNFEEKYRNLFLSTDVNRFQQILDNLISNAIRFSDSGTIELGFSIKKSAKESFIEVYIKDEGIGIPKDKQELIFERFRQGDEDQFNDGTGLGLSISKGLVERLGGEIRCESELGKGSTFFFTLPFSQTDLAEEIEVNEKISNSSLQEKNILIAEDDYNSFLYLKKLFDGENVNISHAHHGSMILNMIDQWAPDLLILDVDIPGNNSMDYLAEMKSRNLKTKIIAQSPFGKKGEEEKFLNAGCHGYIAMPIEKEAFLGEVKRVLV